MVLFPYGFKIYAVALQIDWEIGAAVVFKIYISGSEVVFQV